MAKMNELDAFFSELDNNLEKKTSKTTKKTEDIKEGGNVPIKENIEHISDPTPTSNGGGSNNGGWNTLSKKAKIWAIAGVTMMTGAGAGITAGIMASTRKNNSANEINMVVIPPSGDEHLFLAEAEAMEDYYAKTTYLPNIKIQVIGEGIDINRMVADGVFDIALTTASSWIADAAINNSNGIPETRFFSSATRDNLYWDPTDSTTVDAAYAKYQWVNQNAETGEFGFDREFSSQIGALVDMNNQAASYSSSDASNTGITMTAEGTQVATAAGANQSNLNHESGGEWTKEPASWFRSEMYTSIRNTHLWMGGEVSGYTITPLVNPLTVKTSNTIVNYDPSMGLPTETITRDKLIDDVTFNTAEDLNSYISNIFKYASDYSANTANTTQTEGAVSIGAITNVAAARNVQLKAELGNGFTDEVWKQIHHQSGFLNQSNWTGPRSIFEHTFHYDTTNNYTPGDTNIALTTEENFWIPKDANGNPTETLENEYLSTGYSGGNFDNGTTLLSATFSGERQQTGGYPNWYGEGKETTFNPYASGDGQVVALSVPIYNDGWIVSRDLEKEQLDAINVILNSMLTLESDNDVSTFLPGDFISRFSHSSYDQVDDKTMYNPTK